jgi:type II secretory pathway component PulM
MNLRPTIAGLAALAASLALATACSAQPPPAGAADMQKQIDALRAQATAMQKDLDEIKTLLAPLRARQTPSADSVVLDLGTRPVKGAASARLMLVELTDYQ